MPVVNRSFFSKRVSRTTIGKLPSTADVLIQTDDSVNMGDFKNWATDVTALLNLNSSLEGEGVGSATLGTQYFNRFATATLTTARLLPSKDWIGRNIASSSSFGTGNRTWVRKDYIDQYKVKVSAVNEISQTGIRGFDIFNNGSSNAFTPSIIIETTEFVVTHQAGTFPSQGSGATFLVSLSPEIVSNQATGKYYVDSVSIVTPGSGYSNQNVSSGEVNSILLKGSLFGGLDTVNDITLINIVLTGYNFTIAKSQLETGITLADYSVSSIFQSSSITFMEQSQVSDDYFTIYLSQAPQTPIAANDEILFERGGYSFWSTLNSGSTASSLNLYNKTLNTSLVNVNLLSAGLGDLSYPFYTRTMRVRCPVNLSSLITNFSNEEWSLYVQRHDGVSAYEWDSLVIAGYNLIQTGTISGEPYFEYNLNFKYPTRITIQSSDVIQYCYLYRNLLGNLSDSEVVKVIPGTALGIQFQTLWTSTGFTFPMANLTIDDVNISSTNYPVSHTIYESSPFYYFWTTTDIDTVNYPDNKNFNFGLTFEYSVTSYNNFSANPSYERFLYGYFYYPGLSGTETNDVIRTKNRVRATNSFFIWNSDTPSVTTISDGSQTISTSGVVDASTSRGHSGTTSTQPFLYISISPVNGGQSSVNRPILISNIADASVTTNITVANLVSAVSQTQWQERIGTSEPILTQTKTIYWQREFPSDANTGTHFGKYIKLNNEIIKYTGYTKISDNRYELTGVQRGQLGSTASAHTGSTTLGSDVPIRFTINLRDPHDQQKLRNPLATSGALRLNTNTFSWNEYNFVTDQGFDSSNFYTICGNPRGDVYNRFRYQFPIYGPGGFLTTAETLIKTVTAVDDINNTITLNNVLGLAPRMTVSGIVGIKTGVKISNVDFIAEKVTLTSAGQIFDDPLPNMVGNSINFKFNAIADGQSPLVSLDTIKYASSRRTSQSTLQAASNSVKYYQEPYPIGNRAYEDLYGTAYQALISSRNTFTGIPDDDETYYEPRSTSETFLLQASRDQFFSTVSIAANRLKYLQESISDGQTIVLNDSSGISAGDTIYGTGLPNDGAIIYSVDKYSAASSLIPYPGSVVKSASFSFNSGSTGYIYFSSGDGSDVPVGSLAVGNGIPENTFVVNKFGGTNYYYIIVSNNVTLSFGSVTFGSGYYSPAKIKVREKRQVYSNIILYDYSLSSFNGISCARLKIKKTDVGNLQVNISHVSKIDNTYLNPAYVQQNQTVFYSGIDYTAPVIGFENHPTETQYYYVYVNNDILELQSSITKYNTYTKGIPSVIEIVNIRKITNLSSSTPVDTSYQIKPIPNLNKNTRYALDNGKVVWFYAKWNKDDNELSTYYVPDQYDPSVFWDLDKSEEARYFSVAPEDQKSYTIEETSGSILKQITLSNSTALPILSFTVNDVVYFTNIPSSLSATINTDTTYFITSVNSSSTSDISVSTSEGGAPISFPAATSIKLKVRKALKLFKEIVATTSGSTITFPTAQSGITIGAKVYGPGITTFRTINAITLNASGLTTSAALDSTVNQPQIQQQNFKITGFNAVKTLNTFIQSPENFEVSLVPIIGNVIIGATTYPFNGSSLSGSSYTFNIPTTNLSQLYLKPLQKIAVKYPRVTLQSSITPSNSRIFALAPALTEQRYYKLVITKTVGNYSYVDLSDIKFYYDGVQLSFNNSGQQATAENPGGTYQSNQSYLNQLIDNTNNTWYDYNFNSNGNTSSIIIDFKVPVLANGYSLTTSNVSYQSNPDGWYLESSSDKVSWKRIATTDLYQWSSTTSTYKPTGILSINPIAIDSSYPEFGNIKIDNEIIYYGYRTNYYFGDCIIKNNHSANAVISFSPYNAIKENSVLYNGSDESVNIRVVVTDTYAPNPSATVQIKVAGLEVDDPYITLALSPVNGNTLQLNENYGISDKLDITKKITYINSTTLQLEIGAITQQLVNGDEILLQTSYGLGPGYKISLLKDTKAFYLNKPAINTSVFSTATQTTPFRKMFVVDSQILAGLNDAIIKSASEFNNGKGFKYIPLSGCLNIKPVKCLESKYFATDISKYSTTVYLCDDVLSPEILTGLTTKYSSGSTKNTGKFVLSFEGNEYEIKSIVYPDTSPQVETTQSFIQYIDPSVQATATGIAADSTGNTYVLCQSTSSTRKLILIKFNSSGVKQWDKQVTSSFNYSLQSEVVRVSANGSIIVGYNNTSTNSIGLLKFDANGNVILDKEISSGGVERLYGLRTDASNNVYVVGSTSVTTSLPGGFVSSLSTTGQPDTFTNNQDNGFWTLTLPWTFRWRTGGTETPYNTVYVGTNSYLTFGSGSSAFSGLSASNPAVNKIMIAAANNSGQRISRGIQGNSPNRTYTVIWEGNNSTSGTLGSPRMLWEATFYENDQYRVDIQVANNARGAGASTGTPLTGVFSSTALLAAFPNGATAYQGKRVQFPSSGTGTPSVTQITSSLLYSGGGYNGAYLCKLDTNFNILSQLVYGNSSYVPYDCAIDSTNNIYILGTTSNQVALYKFNSSYALQWRREFGSVSSYQYSKQIGSIQIDSTNNVYISWSSYSPNNVTSPLDFQYSGIIKYDSAGTIVWSKSYDGSGAEYPYGMIIDQATSDLYSYGHTTSGPTGSDFYLLKLNSTGTLQYQKYIGSANYESAVYSQNNTSGNFDYRNGVVYFCGMTDVVGYKPVFGQLALAQTIDGLYGDSFNIGNITLTLDNLTYTASDYGTPTIKTTTFSTTVNNGNKTVGNSSPVLSIVKNGLGSQFDLIKNYVKVNLTTPLKIGAKFKDTAIIKSQNYSTTYERVPNVRGLVYGPQKAVLFDNFKSLIVSYTGSPSYEYTVNKTLSTSTSHSKVGDLTSYIVLSNVNSLHEENVFLTGTGIRVGTKIKKIDYYNKIVYLTQSLSAVPSGNITFYVRKSKINVTLTNGTTENISVGDTVSFIISGNITASSYKYYVSSITSSTSMTINGDFSSNPSSNIMYVSSREGFSTRDFEIGAVELGGFKNNQRQQIVNTSIVADGTDGAIYDIETVQTRATREMFTTSLGRTLGRYVFKQRNFISKNRPIYWKNALTNPVFSTGQKVNNIISSNYNNVPFFISYSGSKIYWSFDVENWSSKELTKTITHVSITASNNVLVAFNDNTFRSIAIQNIASSSGISYTLAGATSLRFLKRVQNYTFIQKETGEVYYTTTDPSSSSASTITWYAIVLNNTNTIIDLQFDDYNYNIIFNTASTTNFYKNYVLSTITGTNMNISTVTDRIKGYNNIFSPVKTTAITYGLGKFIEAGYAEELQTNPITYSTPFVEIYEYENFSDITSPESTAEFHITSLSYSDGQYVASGVNSNLAKQFIRYSPNARVWYGVDIPSGLIATGEEITSICYGGFNRYVAAIWNSSTSSSRFIISTIPSRSTTNLLPADYAIDLTTSKFRLVESSGNTTLYRYRSSLLEGNLLAWDTQYLTYFRYDSGAPVETNELNDYKIIGCQKCSYYSNGGLIVPNFRIANETINSTPISTPISLYTEGLSKPAIVDPGSGYDLSTTFLSVEVESAYGFDGKVNVTTNEFGNIQSVIVAVSGKYYSNIAELTTGLKLVQGTGFDANGNLFLGETDAYIKFSNRLQDSAYSVYGAENNQTGYALIYKNLLNASLYYVMFFDQYGVFIDSVSNITISQISHLASEYAFAQGL